MLFTYTYWLVCETTDCPDGSIGFNVEIDNTGMSTPFIFETSITNLDINDQIGLFDANGIIDFEIISRKTI